MMMRGRPIVPFLFGLLLTVLVIGGMVWAYSTGSDAGALFGIQMPPIIAGLLAVGLLLFVLRLAAPMLMIPLFGLGFWRMGRHGFGHRHGWHRWGHHLGWKRGWGEGLDSEMEVPPFFEEWHRRAHQGQDPSDVDSSA